MPTRTVLTIAGAVLLCIQPAAAADSQAVAEGPARGSNSSPRLKHCFDFDWQFSKSDPAGAEAPKFDDSGWRTLDLPHDFSVEGPLDKNNASGTRGGFLPLGVGWYRKQFTLPESFRSKRVILRFDGVMYFADVYVNGRHLGRQSSPYLSRDWDITDYVNKDGANVVAVRADTPRQMERWYTGSGIYRHVWLMAVEPIRVREFGTYITTPTIEPKNATVNVKTILLNQTDAAVASRLETILLDPAGAEVARGETAVALPAGAAAQAQQQLQVASPRRWSIETPNLYRAVSRVWKGPRLMDEYRSTFGIRTISFDAKNGFSLNGRRVVMCGACLHQDIGALGAAVPDRAIQRRLEVLKAMGVNAIRTSHNPYSIEFLNLCDRKVLAADGQDLAHVQVRVVDRSGTVVPRGEQLVKFQVEGGGRIVGVDNGNLYSHESFKARQRTTYEGYALAIIRAGRRAGATQLTARADGLESATITIKTKASLTVNR